MSKPPAEPLPPTDPPLSFEEVVDAVITALLARLRSVRVLMETQKGGIQPLSPEAQVYGRLLAMEARLEQRRRSARSGARGREVYYLD